MEELGMVTRNNKSVCATFDSCGMDSEFKKGKGFYNTRIPQLYLLQVYRVICMQEIIITVFFYFLVRFNTKSLTDLKLGLSNRQMSSTLTLDSFLENSDIIAYPKTQVMSQNIFNHLLKKSILFLRVLFHIWLNLNDLKPLKINIMVFKGAVLKSSLILLDQICFHPKCQCK